LKPDHLFTVRAHRLRRELAALIAHLDAEYAKLEEKLPEARKLLNDRKGRTMAPVTDAERLASQLVNDGIMNRRDRLKAATWLRECQLMAGWRKFRLTADELQWLYQGREPEHAKIA
jgi:hypothetical protein